VYKTCGWINLPAGSNTHKKVAFREFGLNPFHMERNFTEPDDMRPHEFLAAWREGKKAAVGKAVMMKIIISRFLECRANRSLLRGIISRQVKVGMVIIVDSLTV
jgi:hypothetical protein